MVSFGIEEEFMFLDPAELRPVGVSAALRTEIALDPRLAPYTNREFLASQIEYSSPIFDSLDAARTELGAFRTALAAAAEEHRVIAASSGTPFVTAGPAEIEDDARYRRFGTEFGAIINDHQINSIHVHVGIPSREAGVAALNGIRRWLPTLLALSGNSPYWHAADTGFASWRNIHLRRWSTNGCPPHFVDAADYDRRSSTLVGIAGTLDLATIAWSARLSDKYPTLEVRIGDAQLDADSAVLIAALCRALVVTAMAAADAGSPAGDIPPEMVDAAMWHAGRNGLAAELVDIDARQLVPARVAIEAMISWVTPALEADGDLAWIHSMLERVWRDGTGAQRQRTAFENGGPRQLGRLLSRSLVE